VLASKVTLTLIIFSLTKVSGFIKVEQMQLTPAFAAGLERSGKPVRQDALVKHFMQCVEIHSLVKP
jgi:hypothetical protein